MDVLLGSALSEKTKEAYDRSWGKFKKFCQHVKLDDKLPVDSHTIAKFIAFLHLQGKPVQTIHPIMSAISYKHKILGFQDPCKSFKVSQMLNAFKKNETKFLKEITHYCKFA